jgi:tellurite resistance protein TerC
MHTPLWIWIAFTTLILLLLAFDLVVLQRRFHSIRLRDALLMSAFWIGLALLFNILIVFWRGHKAGLEFFTGYLVEESLSVDNLFVFLMIFKYFQIPAAHQHKVLYWGIVSALVMRFVFIFAGVSLVQRFHPAIYLLGAFLVVTGLRMAMQKEGEIDPGKNPVLRLARRMLPLTPSLHGDRFTVRLEGRRFFTPLLVVLLVVETTDVLFAIDSIPAVLGITLDSFIVYSSNIFAILGLRALYFALAGVMRLFHFLHYGLAAILVFIGVKMVIADWVHIPIGIALGVVALVLATAGTLSLLFPQKTGS